MAVRPCFSDGVIGKGGRGFSRAVLLVKDKDEGLNLKEVVLVMRMIVKLKQWGLGVHSIAMVQIWWP
ncbi:hypothetical protein L1049_018681 [Liquidambar formosana]|uniref:Uncharacterized protein n=1 Tax=Liquidambar formosana TaxID=63359 RepID=A0AAP0RAE2_LIQFO